MSQPKPVLAFEPRSGANLSWSEGPYLEAAVAVVRYRVGKVLHTLHLLEPDRLYSDHGLQATWRWEPVDGGYRLWVELSNERNTPLYLHNVDVVSVPILDLGVPPKYWSFYRNGWNSWTPTFAQHLDDSIYTDPGIPLYRAAHQPHWDPEAEDVVSSEWVTVVADSGAERPDGELQIVDSEFQIRNLRPPALLVGFVTAADQLAQVRMRTDGAELTARCHFDSALLAPGRSTRTERLELRAGPDPLRLLEEWADTLGREMDARIPEAPPTGWCTWYYFYGGNTATEVLENLEAMTGYDLPLDVILLDDGYQTAIGDWFSLNQFRFPEGMEPVARAIRRAGRKVGIWTAPFGAASDSRLLVEHGDWFLKDEAGEPVLGWDHIGTDCYALDCTHPEVQDWLEGTFQRMREEWGVDFFKIDFLLAAARPGRCYDPTATRAQALRRGVEAVRAGIGEEAFLLGCGAPLGPCVGLVDGMRVGPDVDPNWFPLWRHDLSMPSTENALRNSVARAPLHGRLWANDPDCVLVRQRGDDMDLVLNEVRTLAAVVALLGGLTLDSDHLPVIRPGRLKYLRQTLPPTGISARPLDLFEHELPRLLLLPVEREWGRWWVAGVINWEGFTTETTVRLRDLGMPRGHYHVYHYWRRRYLGMTDDAVTIRRHQPHETAVLLFKPISEQPALLTTTFHICQGMVEVASLEEVESAEGVALTVVLRKAGRQFGRVLFSVPPGWRVVEALVDDRQQAPVTEAPGVVSLGLTLEREAVVEVEFEKDSP